MKENHKQRSIPLQIKDLKYKMYQRALHSCKFFGYAGIFIQFKIIRLIGKVMTEEERKEILSQSWKLHTIVESTYLNDSAIKGDAAWLEKQRYLLADMALHLLQTSLTSGEIKKDKLTNNIYSILTIADQFLPEAELAVAKEKLIS